MLKPKRTVGLSIAILATLMMFSIIPLLNVAQVLLLEYRLSAAFAQVEGEDNALVPFAAGGDFSSMTREAMLTQTAVGLIFLVICIVAWRGRPPWIRFVLMAAVALVTLVNLVTTIQRLTQPVDFAVQGIDSGANLGQVGLWVQLLGLIVVPLYIVWYMNRGPARAFYRGYYLTRGAEQTPESSTNSGARSP